MVARSLLASKSGSLRGHDRRDELVGPSQNGTAPPTRAVQTAIRPACPAAMDTPPTPVREPVAPFTENPVIAPELLSA
jgi:hypothetical protein